MIKGISRWTKNPFNPFALWIYARVVWLVVYIKSYILSLSFANLSIVAVAILDLNFSKGKLLSKLVLILTSFVSVLVDLWISLELLLLSELSDED